MSVLGWILAGVLGAFFLAAGVGKLVTPHEKLLLNPNMAWANDFTSAQIRTISVLEVLGALGVVLPWLLDFAPVLTPIAAVGCGLLMVGAAVVHLRRRALSALPPVVVAFGLAAAVAVIRFSQL